MNDPKKVLLIDDDDSLRRIMEYILEGLDVEVVATHSGEDGLRLFAKHAPDLVITDIKMSGIDGYEVLRQVKGCSPKTPVIVITAFGAIDNAVEAMKLGAYDYVTKPFDRVKFSSVVKNALAVAEYASEATEPSERIRREDGLGGIIGASRGMKKLFETIQKVADSAASVLITGESGTGKELVARAIHSCSSRRRGPFVAVNCSAIPRELLESELFGHMRGAFTGAVKDKPGKFQAAEGGTLFLDELGELPLELQAKLLRALQEKTVDPVGGTEPVTVDVRVVAATNLDMDEAVADGRFREDLYYRIAVVPIHIPPLRERKKDIPAMIRHFLRSLGQEHVRFSEEAEEALLLYRWPGNVRELQNAVERLVIMKTSDVILLDDIPAKIKGAVPVVMPRTSWLPDDGYPLEQLEREVVVEALKKNNWNQTNAARFLRIPRHTLIYRMEKYGIAPPDKQSEKNPRAVQIQSQEPA